VKHHAAPDFWSCYRRLPGEIQQSANKSFALLKDDPRHPSVQFRKLDPAVEVVNRGKPAN
jgi:hypothetical protein